MVKPARLVALALVLQLAGVEGASAQRGVPGSWGGSLSVGYNTNILGSSRAERAAFDSRDPHYYFVIDHLEDWQVDFGLWARWDVASFYKKIRLEVGYERRQVANNPILGLDTWSVALRQRLKNRQRYFDLSLAVQPQVYLRHRNDGAALPGDPVFRPEAYRDFEGKLLYNHPIGKVQAAVHVARETQQENEWFRWRDETWDGAGLQLRLPAGPSFAVTPSFELGSCSSPGDATNPVDRSFHERIAGILLRWAGRLPSGSWEAEVGTRWKFRDYTTNDPSDTSRFHRHDRLYSWNAQIARPSGIFAPFMSVEISGRTVSLPAGATASSDEGEYETTIARAGIDWQFDRQH